MNQRIEEMKGTIVMATLAALDRNGVHATHYRDIEVVAELREEDIETTNGICKGARLTATVKYCGSEIIDLATGSVSMTAEAALNNVIQDMLGRGLGRRLTTAIQRLGVMWFSRTGLEYDAAEVEEVEQVVEVEEVRQLPQVSPEEFVRLQAYCFIKSPVFKKAKYHWATEERILYVTMEDNELLGVDFDRIPQTDEEWAVVERELLADLKRIKDEELMENIGYRMSGQAVNTLMAKFYRIAGDYDFADSLPTILYNRVTHTIYIRHWKHNHELIKLDAGVSPDKWAMDGRRNWRALKGFMTDLKARDRVGAVEGLAEFYTVDSSDTEEDLKGYITSRLAAEGDVDFEDEEANLREGDEHEAADNVHRFKEIAQTVTEDEIYDSQLAQWQGLVKNHMFWQQAGERIENGEPAGEVFGGIFGRGQRQPDDLSSTEPF